MPDEYYPYLYLLQDLSRIEASGYCGSFVFFDQNATPKTNSSRRNLLCFLKILFGTKFEDRFMVNYKSMNSVKYIVWLFLLIFPILITAQENSVHPIDVALYKCLKTATATMPRAECYSTASEAWQKAVVDDYQKLLPQLTPELQDILKDEQSSWEKFRDEYEKFVMAKYGKRRGSGYISVRIIELMKPYRERVLELENRFEKSSQTNEEINK